jgi:hypothetical protein
MNQKSSITAATAIFLALSIGLASAHGAATVMFTYAAADLGQGGWGGGPLFSDFTAGGANGVSFNNGGVVQVFKPTSWSFMDSTHVDICGPITSIKPGAPTSTFCLSAVVPGGLPITGTPVIISINGKAVFLMRVTPA